ncbi:MAG: phosphatidate cytidylyltransferase [Planctomycetes bacterium]|nr:phosphatidate cytidylyltransferase [Planctomycetota bacterium]
MRSRLIFGPLMIVLILGGMWLDQWVDAQPLPAWAVTPSRSTWPPGTCIFLICLLMSVWASRELAQMLIDKGITASKRIMTLAAVLGLVVSCLVPTGLNVVDTVAVVASAAVAVLAISIIFFSRHKTVEGVLAATGGALLAFVYLGLMFGFLLAIRREHSVWALLWTILVTKSCDIGAYFTGRAVGRHKLIPWLSPGKTWEGLAGGLALSAIVACLLLAWVIPPERSHWWMGILPGIILGLVGQAGDLFESVFKRDAGIKDSGHSLPGFGGVLDVLDSPLLAAPFAYWWLRLMDLQHAAAVSGG